MKELVAKEKIVGRHKRSLFGLLNFSILFINALLAINLNINIPDSVGEIGR